MSETSPSSSNRTLERAAIILDAVGFQTLSATEIAQRSGLSSSTTHRFCLAMVEYGFLDRLESGKFALGNRINRSPIRTLAEPVILGLRNRTDESAQVWIRVGDYRECIVAYDSTSPLRATAAVGARMPLPAGSAGRILAHSPTTEDLTSLESTGWIESVAGRTPGLGSVSAPIYHQGELIGALCLAMPLARINTSPGREYGHLVVESAAAIQRGLESVK